MAKIKNLQLKIADVTEIYEKFTATRQEIDVLLSMGTMNKRYQQIKEMLDIVIDTDLEDADELSEKVERDIDRNTKSVKVTFPSLYNLKELDSFGELDFGIRNTEEQISLDIHSYKGYYGSDAPERILESNDNYYMSRYEEVTDDWIIFSINDNKKYYPTKIQVRVRGRKRSKSKGDPYALKRFRLKIGNKELNEWVDLHEEVFMASKMDPGLQTFHLDIMGNMNMRTKDSKWRSMKTKNYINFKLEILDNHGASNILIQELRIFGVKI